MKIYNFENIETVLVMGDIHGNFKELFYKLKSQVEGLRHIDDSNETDKKFNYRRLKLFSPFTRNNIKNSLIFVAGDCGFGFNKEMYYHNELKKFNTFLSQYNIYIIFVRGNHDDPRYFNENILNFSNLICVPDYSVVKTKKFTTLCVGGGLSVDREWRINREIFINRFKHDNDYKKKLYWEDEMPVFNQQRLNELKNENIIIDSIVTHTAPSFVDPSCKISDINWNDIDDKLKSDMKKEREVMDNIFEYFNNNKISLKFWAYGHFHINVIKKHFGILFLALDMEMNIYNPLEEIEKYKQNIDFKKQFNTERLATLLNDMNNRPIFFNEDRGEEEGEEENNNFIGEAIF